MVGDGDDVKSMFFWLYLLNCSTQRILVKELF
jgi:hypothetical protein